MSLSEIGFTALIPINEVVVGMLPRISDFSSGLPGLDSFLCDSAKDLHCDHLSHTSLLFHEDFDGVVGYITLANDSIPLKTSEVGDLGLAYKVDLTAYPAVKIGRLAVHKSLQGTGVGNRIMDLAIGELVGTQAITTARLMITDAINDPKVISFYEKCGFVESFWATEQANNHGRGKQRATIKMIRDIYAG
jgi:GNAT superfamily N-acetyltransferase